MKTEPDSFDCKPNLNRRSLIGGGLALGAALGMSEQSQAASSSQQSFILSDSEHSSAELVRKMRFRGDAGKVIWSFDGPAYAVIEGVLTPLYRLIHASIMEVEPKADGGMEVKQYEVGFRCDINTGERLKTLKNPITGEVVNVPYAPVGPTILKFDALNNIDLPEFIGGSRFTVDHKPEHFQQLGDMLMFQYHSEATIETKGKATKTKNDLGLIYGPANEALSPRIKNPTAYIHATDTGAYSGWLNMPDDAPGVQTLRSIGKKVASIQELPSAWLDQAKKTDPDLLKNSESIFLRKQIKFQN
jgi:hypothetical protein